MEPGIRMTIAGGVHFPRDARLVPARLMQALQRETRRLGVGLQYGTELTGVRVNGARIDAAQTRNGTIEADEFVLAAGVWSSPLARTLGLSLPMQSGKGYSPTVEKPPATMRTCAILSESRAAVTPMGPALRFGSAAAFATAFAMPVASSARGVVAEILVSGVYERALIWM